MAYDYENRKGNDYYVDHGSEGTDITRDVYSEETAAEISEPYRASDRAADRDDNRDGVSEGRGIGYAALAISIISLFVLPVLLGACGIIVGYIARRRGAGALGGWAMGIGIVSLVLGIFITPFLTQRKKLGGISVKLFVFLVLLLLFPLQALHSVLLPACRFLLSSSTIVSSGTLRTIWPLRKRSPSPRAPAIPISASLASPGPLTAHPRTATLIGALTLEMYSSTSFAMLMRSISIRPHVGHEISVAAFEARPNDFSSSLATFTSSTGSALREIRSVFPIPLLKIAPSPAALLPFRQTACPIL